MRNRFFKGQEIFRVKTPDQRRRRSVITKTEERFLDRSKQTVDLAACPCGAVLHDIKEVAAVCGVCTRPLCAACARVRCARCGTTSCVAHSARSLSGNTVCTAHGLCGVLFS